MSVFNEENTVEEYVRDLLTPLWAFVSPEELRRADDAVFAADRLKDSLIRLNPAIEENPDRVEDVLYRLRAIILSVRSDGLVKANEEFSAWLSGDRSMPFGSDGEHVTIRLIDFDDLSNNDYVVTTQYRFTGKGQTRIPDVVLLVNGMPLVIVEAKTPTRDCVSWADGALQINDYEVDIPELFVPNVLSVATEGKEFRYGSVRVPVDLWGPWRVDGDEQLSPLERVGSAVRSMLTPINVLDFLANFTTYANDNKRRRIKIVARYQQFDGANRIVEEFYWPVKERVDLAFSRLWKVTVMLFAGELRLHLTWVTRL